MERRIVFISSFIVFYSLCIVSLGSSVFNHRLMRRGFGFLLCFLLALFTFHRVSLCSGLFFSYSICRTVAQLYVYLSQFLVIQPVFSLLDLL